MRQLNFPTYTFRFKNTENKPSIFDRIRKKFVALTPEEWVRQHVIHFLIENQGISEVRINVEKQLKLHGTIKRYDIVVFNRDGSIFLIVECKAPEIAISQETFDQIARYNKVADAAYLMVTNGLEHYYCAMDYKAERYIFLQDFPSETT